MSKIITDHIETYFDHYDMADYDEEISNEEN